MPDGRAVLESDQDELLTPREVAQLTKLSERTLANHRWQGIGPRFTKLSPGRGGRVRYRRRDVEQWVDQAA